MRPIGTLTLTLSLSLSVLALAAAAPAEAQIVGERSYAPVPARNLFLPDSRLPGPSIWDEVEDIRGDIRRAREAGWLTPREARRLDREARRIAAAAARSGEDGLSDSERRELRARGEAVRSVITRP